MFVQKCARIASNLPTEMNCTHQNSHKDLNQNYQYYIEIDILQRKILSEINFEKKKSSIYSIFDYNFQ